MRLYSIKRKSDGKFYVSAQGSYAIHSGREQYQFATKPSQFLKTPDGVAGNLRKLCSIPYRDEREKWPEVEWGNFEASKLELYEVLMMDVDIISMTATPAEKFIQIEAIERVPLSRRERLAESEGTS